jgi:Spy/CpxP family protein refolding chaperone
MLRACAYLLALAMLSGTVSTCAAQAATASGPKLIAAAKHSKHPKRYKHARPKRPKGQKPPKFKNR